MPVLNTNLLASNVSSFCRACKCQGLLTSMSSNHTEDLNEASADRLLHKEAQHTCPFKPNVSKIPTSESCHVHETICGQYILLVACSISLNIQFLQGLIVPSCDVAKGSCVCHWRLRDHHNADSIVGKKEPA